MLLEMGEAIFLGVGCRQQDQRSPRNAGGISLAPSLEPEEHHSSHLAPYLFITCLMGVGKHTITRIVTCT